MSIFLSKIQKYCEEKFKISLNSTAEAANRMTALRDSSTWLQMFEYLNFKLKN